MNIIEPSINTLFGIPIKKVNINREFTKDELQLLLSKIPMWKDEKRGMVNHRSKDLYLFDNFVILSLSSNFLFFNSFKDFQELELLSFSLVFVNFLISVSSFLCCFLRSLTIDIKPFVYTVI